MNPEQVEKRYEDRILQNSIERVINTSVSIIGSLKPEGERMEELRDINLQDWEDLKYDVVRLWNEERNRIFQKRLDAQKAASAKANDIGDNHTPRTLVG